MVKKKSTPKKASAALQKKPAPQENPVCSDAPIQEQIAVLAYSYWEARGCQGGTPDEDWFRAEHEILNRTKS